MKKLCNFVKRAESIDEKVISFRQKGPPSRNCSVNFVEQEDPLL